MKLTKQQVQALVDQEDEKQNKIITAHNKKVEERERAKNLPKAKKIVKLMTDLEKETESCGLHALDYRLRDESEKSRLNKVLNAMSTEEGHMPSFDRSAYERKIHIASIDASDMETLMRKLNSN